MFSQRQHILKFPNAWLVVGYLFEYNAWGLQLHWDEIDEADRKPYASRFRHSFEISLGMYQHTWFGMFFLQMHISDLGYFDRFNSARWTGRYDPIIGIKRPYFFWF